MSDGRTHWDECWREHLDCAVAKAEAAERECAKLDEALIAEIARRKNAEARVAELEHSLVTLTSTLADVIQRAEAAQRDAERMRDALQKISNWPNEDDEWDAVDKFNAIRDFAALNKDRP